MKPSRIIAPLTVLALPVMAVPALAGPEYTSASGGTFTFYGQVDPAIVSFDDGVDTDTDLADNSKSNTRFGFWLRQPFGEDELRFQFETALGFRPSSGLGQNSQPDVWEWDKTFIRRVDISYKSARYGTFYIGQGSMASDGSGSTDLSGTGVVSDVGLGDYVGARFLRTSSGALSNVSMGDAFINLDGTRYGRVRYDTPGFNNFTVGIAYGKNILNASDDNKYYDIALNYKNTLPNGTEVAGGIGYMVIDTDVGPNVKDTFGSVSVLLESGWNGTFSAGSRDPDGSFYMAKIGYLAKNWVAWGDTAVSVDYYHSDDFASIGGSGDSYGLAVVQNVDQYDLQLYLGYRNYSYDDNIASYKDANSLVTGVKWTF